MSEYTKNINPMKRLNIEFDGIWSVMSKHPEYKNSFEIVQLFKKLRWVMTYSDGLDTSILCLEKILNWACAQRRGSVEFITKIDIIRELLPELEEFARQRKAKESLVIKDETSVIFLSHSYNDREYALLLKNFINGFGVDDKRLIFTSHNDNGVPLSRNIYNHLKANIHSNTLMLILWSPNFFNSYACMCEAGATWVTDCKYVNICIDPEFFNDEKFTKIPLDIKNAGIALNAISKDNVINLGKMICEKIGLQINDSQLNAQSEMFLMALNNLNNQKSGEENK